MLSAVKDRSQRPGHARRALTASRLFSDDDERTGGTASKLATMSEEAEDGSSAAAAAAVASPIRGGRLFDSMGSINGSTHAARRMSPHPHDDDHDDLEGENEDESVATANASEDTDDCNMSFSPTSLRVPSPSAPPASALARRPAGPTKQMFASSRKRPPSGSDQGGRLSSFDDNDNDDTNELNDGGSEKENNLREEDEDAAFFGLPTVTPGPGGNDIAPAPGTGGLVKFGSGTTTTSGNPFRPLPQCSASGLPQPSQVQRVRSTDSHDTHSTTASSSSVASTSPVPRTTGTMLPFLSSTGFAPAAGQYSFTASPIDETEEDIDRLFSGVGNKVRRLNLGPDDASSSTTVCYGKGGGGNLGGGGKSKREGFKKSRGEGGLFADLATAACNDADTHKMGRIHEEDEDMDRISPTDVTSFPPIPPQTPKRGTTRSRMDGSGGSSDSVAPGTPKISRSARSSRSGRGGGGGGGDAVTPGTPNHSLDRICVGGGGAGGTAVSHTPYRGGPPETPVLERRTVRRTPKVFTFADDTIDNGMGGGYEDGAGGGSSSAKGRFDTDFEIVGKPLGNGSFGTVHKCLSRLDACFYAIKVANRRTRGVADRHRMLKEVHALAALSDLADTAAFHIVRYHQAWMEDKRLYIQTELCTSTLQSEISCGRPMPLQRRYKLLREMLLALELIHKHGMVHLDIKPENIFIKNDQFKLGDFGLVSQITSDSEVEEGDSRYMSMELLSGEHANLTKSDIFSLGATLYEVCLGRPLPANGQEWQDIRAGILLPMPQTPEELQQIIRGMMNPDPSQRADATTLLKKKELLSNEQKQLLLEKNKVHEANMALALQQERLKKLKPGPVGPGKLVRHNTWNGFL